MVLRIAIPSKLIFPNDKNNFIEKEPAYVTFLTPIALK